MPLDPFSEQLDTFKKPPANLHLNFYFFNLTNPNDVINHGEKPVFKEIGPYSYRIDRHKENVFFNDNGDRVWFEQRMWYYFDREKSVGSDMDTFTNLDLVAYKVTKTAYDAGTSLFLLKTLVRMHRDKPFTTHTINEFLFGAEDKLIKKASKMAGVSLPHYKFGLFIDKFTGESKNATVVENYTLHTGKEDINQYQMVLKYGDQSSFNGIWPQTDTSKDYNQFHGRFGSSFGPNVDTNEKLEAFSSDTCSFLQYDFAANTVRDGFDAYRFNLDLNEWRDSTGKLNKAMCDEEARDDPATCAQEGIFNMTTCKGAALMMSLPHFYSADPAYLDMVEGLKPDAEKHGSHLEVDPLTGTVLYIARRIQINVGLHKMDFPKYSDLPDYTLMPITWLEVEGGVNQQGLDSLQTMVHDKYEMLGNASYIALGVGVVVLLVSIIGLVIGKKKCGSSSNRADGYGNSGPEMAPLRT